MRTPAFVTVVCVLGVAALASGQVLFQHVGANDPETEGWTRNFYDNGGSWPVEGRPLAPDPSFPGVDAWQIEADSGEINYFQVVAGEDRTQALTQGFALTATWRMEWCRPEQNFQGNNCLEARLPDRKVEMRMGYGDTEDQRAVILRDDNWPNSPVVPLGDDDYYTVKLVYDPGDGMVDLYVNGSLELENASTLQDDVDVVDNFWVLWGGCNAGNANDAINDYSSIQFEIIPEPASVAFLILGVPVLLRIRRKA